MPPFPPVLQIDLYHMMGAGVNHPHISTFYAGVGAVCATGG